MISRPNKRRHHLRAAFLFSALVPISFASNSDPAIAQSPTAEPQLDFARIIPGDANFFIEVRDLERIRDSFRSLGIWNLMRGIAETGGPTTQPWQRRSEQLLGMTSEQMIERVLGRRSALFSKHSDDWQNGILIAEVESRTAVNRLLTIWRARPLADEGVVRRHRLRGGLICASFENILIVGPEEDPDGLLGRSILLLAGKSGPHLAGQSAFASLRTRLPDDADAVIFARWPSDYRFAFADCERVMASVRHTDRQTRCEISGRLRNPSSSGQSTLTLATLTSIPGDALVSWTTARIYSPPYDDVLDFSHGPSGLISALQRVLPDWFADATHLETLANGDTSVFLGASNEGDLRFPTLCVRLSTTTPAALQKSLEAVFGVFSGLVDIFSRPPDATAKITEIEHDDDTDPPISHLPIGELLARRKSVNFLSPLELAWASTDDAVWVGTNRSLVRSAISAAAPSPNRKPDNEISRSIESLASDQSDKIFEAGHLYGRAMAAVIESWQTYIETNHPYANDDAWWQLWAMGKLAEQSRLGVALHDDPKRRGAATVAEVDPFSPAAGRLQVGDTIVTAGRMRLSNTHPSRSVATRYDARGSATQFDLTVIRNNERVNVSIPVPPVPEYRMQHFRPIAAIRLLRTLLQSVESAAYVRIADEPAYLNLRFDIRWNTTVDSRDEP